MLFFCSYIRQKIMSDKFYESMSMEQMSSDQWELICSGCSWCCMEKLIDEDTGILYFTRAACKYLDLSTGKCSVYSKRFEFKHDCLKITPSLLSEKAHFLPSTCAYKQLYYLKILPQWHHLVSGDKQLIHKNNISAIYNSVSGENIHPEDLQDYIC